MTQPPMPAPDAPIAESPEDLSAVSWLLEELRRTLDAAHKALRRHLRETESLSGSDVDTVDPSVLRQARQQLHQGAGALELAGMGPAASLLRAGEAAVGRMIQKPALADAAAVEAIERASFALLDYLARLLAGKPATALSLFPQYRAVKELAGADRVHPADLWPVAWRWQPVPLGDLFPPRAADAAARTAAETQLLALMRQPRGPAAGRMRDLFGSLARGAAQPRLATLWALASGFFEGQSRGLLQSNVYGKRMASRLLAQLRLAERAGPGGAPEVSERLAQDLLFFCAQAGPAADVPGPSSLAAVRRIYGLTRSTPVDYETPRLGRFDPAWVTQARKRVGAAKDSWSAVAGDELHRLPGLVEQFSLVGDSLRRLYPQGDKLADALQDAIVETVDRGRPPAPELAMEVATSMLYLDASLEDADFDDPDLGTRVLRLAQRVAQVRQGLQAPPLEGWMEDLYRRVSDRQTLGSVVQELRASLSEIEKAIDPYFRDPSQRRLLIPVPGLLQSMRGVLTVLGIDQAAAAVVRMRDDVDALAQTEVDAQQAQQTGTFDRLAGNLGALGFLIDMLSVQPALAKSLFVFDAAEGRLRSQTGAGSHRAAQIAGHDGAAAADDLIGQVQSVAQAAARDDVSIDAVTQDLARLSQQATAADQPVLARAVSAAQAALEAADDDDARRQVRDELAQAVAAMAPPPPAVDAPAASAPIPPPAPPAAPGMTGLEDDAEMLGIFFDEAREVIAGAREALDSLSRAPGGLEDLTTVRRAFHTLKGSSRMVGLREFGDAAWACEQLYNARLAEAPHASDELAGFTAEALDYFAGWVDALAAGTDAGHRAAALQGAADSLRLQGVGLPVPVPVPVPGAAAALPGVPMTAPQAVPALTDRVPGLPSAADLALGAPLPGAGAGLDSPAGSDVQPQDAGAFAGRAAPAEALALGEAVELSGAALADFPFELPAQPPVVAPAVAPVDAGPPAGEADAGGTLDLRLDEPYDMPTVAAEPPADTEWLSTDLAADLPADMARPDTGDAAIPRVAEGGFEPVFEQHFAPAFEPLPEPVPAPAPADDVPAGDGPAGEGLAGDGHFAATAPAELDALGMHAPALALPEPALEPFGLSFAPLAESVPAEPLPEVSFELDLAGLDGAVEPPAAVSEAAAPVIEPDAAMAGDATPLPTLDAAVGDAIAVAVPTPASEAAAEAIPEPTAQVTPEAWAGVGADTLPGVPALDEPDLDAEAYKVIGPLRIGIPLFNIYLNEADELSRRLVTELAEWSHELRRPVGDTAVALAHSLAGSSSTVGFTDLSQLARSLEHALMRSNAAGSGDPSEADLFTRVAEEIRRLLHQFAAGLLRTPDPQITESLAAHERQAALRPVPLAEPAAEIPGEPPAPEPGPAAHEAAHDAPVADAEPVAGPPAHDPPADSLTQPAPLDLGHVELVPLAPVAGRVEPTRVASAGALDSDQDIDAVDAVDAELFPIFEEEGQELLPQLASRMREWARRPADPGGASACMRTLHTLKGGARLAGAMRLGELAHRLETAIEHLLQRGEVGAADVEHLLGRVDTLNAVFDALRGAGAAPAPAPSMSAMPVEPLAEADWGRAPSPGTGRMPADVAAQGADGIDELPGQGRIDARPAGPSPGGLIDWSRFSAGLAAAAPPAPEAAAAASSSAVRVRVPLLDRLVNQAGEVSITRSRIESDVSQLKGSLTDLTENLERLRAQLRDLELQAETQISSRMEAAKAAAESFDPLELDRFTRFQELTRMMAESVNDVATVQRSLQRTLQSTEDELAAQARLTRDLQDDLLRTRMVEFEGLSERLYRVVRQAAKETGKQVRLDLVGGSIEVDRGVLDRMTGSFEHLLRNCVSHGIELPAERVAAGKDAIGQITVSLTQEGNEVGIEFRDDGAGLNLSRIRERGIATGLLAPDQPASDAELANLIFTPGFSTAASVTELAGRGVGMDVVRSDVVAMGGRIETATAAGQGSSFRLVLPLTTAVTRVVMLRCGARTVAVPSTLIEIVRRVPAAELPGCYASGAFPFGDKLLPFFWLGALLQGDARSAEPARSATVVVVRSAQQRVALHVDEVVGNQEVVVKNLGAQLSRVPGLAGVTLLASGVPALIYNPVALATLYGEAARLASATEAAAEAAAPGGASVQPRAPLVLVVDDSLTVRRVTQRLLVREGYRVSLAKDGMDALERLAEEKPAVVLSDIEMPRMDGFDLVRNLRGDSRWRDLPVIMITSRIAQKHRDVAAELGVNHYLGKPYGEEDLLALVAHYASSPELA